MKPYQKILATILVNLELAKPEDLNSKNIDDVFGQYDGNDNIMDEINSLRYGEVVTGITCEWSRHYESKSVAAKMYDGTWVGWTFWYGGGEHGEPESIEWMDDAYDLDVTEEQRMVTVQTFNKVVSDERTL